MKRKDALWVMQMCRDRDARSEAEREAFDTAIEALKSESIFTAEAVPQSEQYKKGFEDAKRAFLVEYARESQNMRKRIAQLEVMLNAQKVIIADRQEGEWTNDEHDMPRCSNCGYMPEFNNHIDDYYYSDFCPNCGSDMRGEDK